MALFGVGFARKSPLKSDTARRSAKGAPDRSNGSETGSQPGDGTDGETSPQSYKIVDRIIELGLEPEPQSFTVFYAYDAGGHPEVTNSIDTQLAAGEKISKHFVDEVFAANFGSDRDIKSVADISHGLTTHVKSVQKLIDQGLQHGAEFSRDVSGISKNLRGAESPRAVSKHASELQNSNSVLMKKMKSTAQGLSEAQKNVERLEHELEQVRVKANTDHLTLLANRRRMEDFLNQTIAESDPDTNPLSYVLIDIDHFKAVNDNFGHDAGDNILRHYGLLLRRNTKGKDLAARYGGEEFSLVLPNTTLEGARKIAEILRKSFEDCEWSSRQNGRDIGTVTASFGVAEHRQGETPEELMKRADTALYEAKDAGRNQVICAGGS